ncbi:hypothetical protein [Propionivibrio sp.]|uniref:hypothetical protein n=1 Tax=Propionivibrio sp. TaxID=2212460 RepID=UPI003BF1889C
MFGEAIELGPRTNDKPEAAAMAEVLQVLRHHPRVAFIERQNTGAAKVGKSFIKFGWRGCSDLIGMMKDGRWLAVEVKAQNHVAQNQEIAKLFEGYQRMSIEKVDATAKKQRGGFRAGGGRKKGVPNKITRTLKELASGHIEAALAAIVEAFSDPVTPVAVRIAAAGMLLDRACGRPGVAPDESTNVTLGSATIAELDAFHAETIAKTEAMRLQVQAERDAGLRG